MKPRTALKLGRVSNLPTIWTNCLVGFAIANETPCLLTLIIICFAFSFFYIAGMFLNDVFDYQWDKEHQPERPIVTGETTRREVIQYSLFLLAAGFILVIIGSTEKQVFASILSTVILIVCILIYDWKHKDWDISPWLMGGCRLMVYWTVALTAAPFSYKFAVPGLCLMGYIAGITYLARTEHINKLTAWWPVCLLGSPLVYAIFLTQHSPLLLFLALTLAIWLGSSVRKLLPGPQRSVPQSISNLLAGICLIDALILAGMLQYTMAAGGVFAFFLTLFLQKRIKAT